MSNFVPGLYFLPGPLQCNSQCFLYSKTWNGLGVLQDLRLEQFRPDRRRRKQV